MQHSSTDRPWLITETGFFYKAPRRVAPLGATSSASEVAAKHNEILAAVIEAGLVGASEIAPVRLDESPARVQSSLTQIESLLHERAGVRQLPRG